MNVTHQQELKCSVKRCDMCVSKKPKVIQIKASPATAEPNLLSPNKPVASKAKHLLSLDVYSGTKTIYTNLHFLQTISLRFASL